MSRCIRFFALTLIALCIAGCTGKSTQTAQAPGASSAPASTAAPDANASPVTSAAPAAAASADPNLLAYGNGTILRRYPDGLDHPEGVVTSGDSMPATVKAPFTYVFELPGVAAISGFSADLPAKDADKSNGVSVAIAVSTTSATDGYRDVGTLTTDAQGGAKTLAANVSARWVRAVVQSPGTDSFETLSATGTLAPRPAGAPAPAGGYVVLTGSPYAGGAFVATSSEEHPDYLQVVQIGTTGVDGQVCNATAGGSAFPGTFDGRSWRYGTTYGGNDSTGRLVLNDEGTVLAGRDDAEGSGARIFARQTIPAEQKGCFPQRFGSGKTNVLVLDRESGDAVYPLDDDPDDLGGVPGTRFTRMAAGLLRPADLLGADAVWFEGVCDADHLFSAAQGAELMRWVAQGHKLLITDADMCGGDPAHPTHYGFLPYPFTTDNPGARGMHGDGLYVVEDDALGSADRTDPKLFVDTPAYDHGDNDLGDANTVTTLDPHWCGHLFGTNANGINGFQQIYALYGKGLIVYEGLDHDDGSIPAYRKIRQLQFSVTPESDLPCTRKVSAALIVSPDGHGTFVPGKAATPVFHMSAYANQGWKGHVTVTTSGDFGAQVTPSAFDLKGGVQTLSVTVSVPASAKPGQYAVIVSGDAGNGVTSQATIQLVAAVPLAKQLKVQRRIRIYGIHFDVDSAHIQPASEPVIAQIAQIMRGDPQWRFRVEGHTDSDGGLQHNKVLSQHRAEAVVADLVRRYHIAKSRLVPAGYGYSHPVASNATAAGKALNRRVELFRL